MLMTADMWRASSLLVLACCLTACPSPVGPRAIVAGTWASIRQVPGSGLSMTLSQDHRNVAGSGTYRIEADGGGTFEVTGTFDDPRISLAFVYDNGTRATYTALLSSPDHITGTITYPGLAPYTLEFVRVPAGTR